MKHILTTPITKVIPQISIMDVAKLYAYFQVARIINASLEGFADDGRKALEKEANRLKGV